MRTDKKFDPRMMRSCTAGTDEGGAGGAGETGGTGAATTEGKATGDAGTTGGGEGGQTTTQTNESNEPDGSNWDDATKNYITKLRKESAGYRTKAKDLSTKVEGLEGQFDEFKTNIGKALGIDNGNEATPEQQIETLTGALEESMTANEIYKVAMENDIGKDGIEYFEFLLHKRLGELGEDESIDEDGLSEIAKDVKSKLVTTPANTSVSNGGDNGATANPNNTTDVITPDQFRAMTMGDKTALYQKDEALYNRLVAESKAQRKFI